jgi:hypothetical protein
MSDQRKVLPSRKTNFSLIAYQDKLRGFLQKEVKSKNLKITIVILSLRMCGLSMFKVTRFKKISQVFRYGGLQIGLFYEKKLSQTGFQQKLGSQMMYVFPEHF